MSSFPESSFEDSRDGPGFLSRLGIAVFLVSAGIGLAILMAAG